MITDSQHWILPRDWQNPSSAPRTCSSPEAETSQQWHTAKPRTLRHGCEHCVNLIIEPVLISQRAQVVQGQRVFLVDHLKGGHRVLNDRGSVSVNLRKDGVFAAIWGDKVQSIWSKCFINKLLSSTTDLLLKSMLNVLLRCLSTSVFCRGMKLPYIR